jgi:Fe-S-cluster containining protein
LRVTEKKPEDAPVASNGLVPVSIDVPIGGRPFRVKLQVPEAPMRASELLPLFHATTDFLMKAAAQESASGGRPVTCARGCAACCRQLVPVSEVEVRQLHGLIEALPTERRAVIRGRIDAAMRRLHEAGWMARMEQFDDLWDDALVTFIRDYFRLWIDCPFLDGDSCSIYAQRPAACREHLVVSAPDLCSGPDEAGVERLPIPTEVVSRALRCFNTTAGFGRKEWRPMIVALGWAQDQSREAVQGTGPELLQRFFERLVGDPPAPDEG